MSVPADCVRGAGFAVTEGAWETGDEAFSFLSETEFRVPFDKEYVSPLYFFCPNTSSSDKF